MTLLAARKASGETVTGTAEMIQSTPSVQGGVVREPTYLVVVAVVRCVRYNKGAGCGIADEIDRR